MTDQDNLRDRIAECQRQVLKRRALISDVDLPDYLAQAIIDEFGLTVETGQFGVTMKRVVGKWEKQ